LQHQKKQLLRKGKNAEETAFFGALFIFSSVLFRQMKF